MSTPPSADAAGAGAGGDSIPSAPDSGSEGFNLGTVHERVSAVVADRQCVVQGDRSWTYREITERSRRLARLLHDHGLGVRTERHQLEGHESGQDHLGLYLYNGNEYIEGMLGAYKARVAPFNVNYRYVEEELLYLLSDAKPRALLYHASFAPVLERVLPQLEGLELLLQVADSSGNPLLEGAVDYEEALESVPPELPPTEPSPDDLYIIYTGGTTGMPKAVLWRQHDIFHAAMGGRIFGTWDLLETYDQLVERLLPTDDVRVLSIPPLMHAAAQWACFYYFALGATVVFPKNVHNLDPAEIWRTVERERVIGLTVVGDSMARPLVEELENGSYDTSSVMALGSGGAILSEGIKQRFLAVLPNLIISDVAGASETGAQMGTMSTSGSVQTGRFTAGPGTTVLDEDMTKELSAGDESIGWLAQSGAVPLGYLGDPQKTARTFPVVGSVRYSIPGDRARLLADGQIELLGRDSVTINSGGEKIFAEEVEQAIVHHPDVVDVVVAGRPSERWGQEVVALVQVVEGSQVTPEELIEEAGKHLARYKLPKAVGFEKQIVRSPSGKADYRWAKRQALEV
ncbi:MAG TPA: acyl-CoA synthetase [Acidimicrobiales bacterium]|nr:acyl-CoA synthetase [Acidimicrobiales bacterium]